MWLVHEATKAVKMTEAEPAGMMMSQAMDCLEPPPGSRETRRMLLRALIQVHSKLCFSVAEDVVSREKSVSGGVRGDHTLGGQP